ncbi:TPA: EpsG family protein [Streptococcus suis]
MDNSNQNIIIIKENLVLNYRIKVTNILALPMIIFQFILFSFNTYNVDMPNYIIRYTNIMKFGPNYFGNLVDSGFNYFMFYVQKLGLDYTGFLIVSGILTYSLLLALCNLYKADYLYFFALFFATFFFLEVVILRQFISSIFLALAFMFFEENTTLKNNIIGIFFLCISISMHIVALLGVVYYFLINFELKKLIKIAIIGLFLSFGLTTRLLKILTNLLGAKFALYTNTFDNSVVSFLAKVIFLVISFILFYEIFKEIISHKKLYTPKQVRLSELALKMTLINSFSLPLMMVDISFERLLILPIFIYLLSIACFLGGRAPFTRKKILIIGIVILWVIISYRIFVWSDSIGTTIPVLNYNLFWSE